MIKKGAQSELKVVQNVQGGYPKSPGETGREKVPVKFRLLGPLLTNLATLGRFGVPFSRTLDFEGIPKLINFT